MKNKLLLFGSCFLFLTSMMHAQNKSKTIEINSQTNLFSNNDTSNPCISPQEYAALNKEVNDNLIKFGLDKKENRNLLTTSLIWPLRLATGFTQCEYHFIGAYVDQNTATTTIQDYDCGTNTYDGHHGTDIAIWPYSLYKMDNNQVEVIAAAAGTIIQKNDGNYDRNCGSNTLTANSIIIQHADGTYALYWHMKNGSVNTKAVGQTVITGEKLGVVGSSGSSSGPHLHFEIWSGSTNNTYKDPFSGTCNLLNTTSWWTSQRPHAEPAIMKTSVHPTDITLATCPNSDVPNESETFIVPFQGPGLSPGYAKFYVFWRELPVNSVIVSRILNPNGTVFNTWNHTIPTYNKISYYGFSKLLPTIDGVYTFEASYNGVSCSKTFTITHNLGIPEISNVDYFQVHPNPTKDVLNIEIQDDFGIRSMIIVNEIGQTVIIKKENFKTLDVSALSNGIYFIKLNGANETLTKKFIKD